MVSRSIFFLIIHIANLSDKLSERMDLFESHCNRFEKLCSLLIRQRTTIVKHRQYAIDLNGYRPRTRTGRLLRIANANVQNVPASKQEKRRERDSEKEQTYELKAGRDAKVQWNRKRRMQ